MKTQLTFLAAALTVLASLALMPIAAQSQPDSNILKKTIEAQASCANFVRYDDTNAYFGFGEYRSSLDEPRALVPSEVQVAPLDGSAGFSLATPDSAVDMLTNGNDAYILTYSGLELWDLGQRKMTSKFATYDIDRDMKYKEHPVAMARYNDTLIIAHGRLGVSFFDMKAQKLIKGYRLIEAQAPLRSMATGVTIQGQYAYVTVDNFNSDPQTDKPAFRGMVIVDMETQTVAATLANTDPGQTSIVSDSKTLVVSFGGSPLWTYKIDGLGKTQLNDPSNRIWKFPYSGEPIGHASMDDQFYYTCFVFPPAQSGGKYTHHPLALDRAALHLN